MLALLLKKLGECILLDPSSSIGKMMYTSPLEQEGLQWAEGSYRRSRLSAALSSRGILFNLQRHAGQSSPTTEQVRRDRSGHNCPLPFRSPDSYCPTFGSHRLSCLFTIDHLFVDIDDISGLLPAASMWLSLDRDRQYI